jgi:hypothetical protein
MNKRVVATILWFNVGWVVGSMSSFFLGLPGGLDLAMSVAFAAFIWWDPAHRLWPDRARVARAERSLPQSSRIGAQ